MIKNDKKIHDVNQIIIENIQKKGKHFAIWVNETQDIDM